MMNAEAEKNQHIEATEGACPLFNSDKYTVQRIRLQKESLNTSSEQEQQDRARVMEKERD